MMTDTKYKNELQTLMEDMALRCKVNDPLISDSMPLDWSFKLYQLITRGFHTYFKYKIEGMKREDVTALQRASVRLGGWWFEGRIVPWEEWHEIYEGWKCL